MTPPDEEVPESPLMEPSRERAIGRALPWIVALLSAAAFLPGLTAGWSPLGAEAVALAPLRLVPADAWKLLSSFPKGEVYSPLAWAAHAACGWLPGGPVPHHLFSIALHAVNAALLYLGLVGLLALNPGPDGAAPLRARLASAAAVLFFSLHPLRAEAVTWLSCQGILLSATFSLLSLLAFVRTRTDEPHAGLWSKASVAACACAVLSHSAAWPVPLILLTLGWRMPAPVRGGRSDPRDMPPAVPTALRLFLIGAMGWVFLMQGLELGATPGSTAALRVWRWSAGQAYALGRTLAPFGLLPLRPAAGPSDVHGRALLGLTALLSLAAAAWLGRRRLPCAPWLWACLVALAAPFPLPVGSQLRGAADHWTYLPALALSVAAAFAAARFWPASVRGRRASAWAAAGLLALAALTFRQTGRWRDMRRLLANNASAEPACWECGLVLSRIERSLGDAPAAAGRLSNAADILDRELSPPLYGRMHAAGIVDRALALRADRRDEAGLLLRAATRLDPSDGRAHLHLAMLLEAEGDLDGALREATESVRCSPDSKHSLNALGWYLSRVGRLREAEARYRAALAIDPRFKIAVNNLAALLSRPGRACSAPEHINRGLALANGGDLEAAIRETEAALRCDSGSALAHNNLGWFFQRQGRWKEAKGHYLQALAKDPTNALTLGNLRAVYAATGDECLAPGKASERLNLGFQAYRQGRLKEAIRETEAALRCNPGSASAHNNLGFFLQQSGRLPEALEQFQLAARLAPGDTLAANNLRNLKATLGLP